MTKIFRGVNMEIHSQPIYEQLMFSAMIPIVLARQPLYAQNR
jgi:hypothetical protein